MTLFGWIYIVLQVLGALLIISEVGKPRRPRTSTDVSIILLVSGLMTWGLYAWGLH